MRLNKFLAQSGIASRRKSDELIKMATTEVNGVLGFDPAYDVKKSDIVKYLLSDAGQIKVWPTILPLLNNEKTLYFSHGFGIVYNDKTNIIPPDMDVVLVAPKGSGLTVRSKFLEGHGINASYAIHQNFSGNAEETCRALAFGIGSGYLFETTFESLNIV